MIPALREAFNRRFTAGAYQQFLKDLEASAGTPIAFRVSETPCFFPRTLLDQMAAYGRDLVLQLVNNAEYLVFGRQPNRRYGREWTRSPSASKNIEDRSVE